LLRGRQPFVHYCDTYLFEHSGWIIAGVV
jgi:hypothetical protein